RIIDSQLARRCDGVGDVDRKISREPFLTVWAQVRHLYRWAGRTGNIGGFPYHFVERFQAAVKRIRPVVRGEFVFLAVEREPRLGDTVGDAPRGRAEVRMTAKVPFEIVETEDDVGDFAISIGDFDRSDDGPESDDLDAHFAVRERVQFDRSAVRGFAEVHLLK